MATRSRILAWRIQWTEQPSRVRGDAKNRTTYIVHANMLSNI